MYCRKDVPPFPLIDARRIGKCLVYPLCKQDALQLLLREYLDAYYDAPARRNLVRELWPDEAERGERTMLNMLTARGKNGFLRVVAIVCRDLGVTPEAFHERAYRAYADGWRPNIHLPKLAEETPPVPEDPEGEFLAARDYTFKEIRRILKMPARERSLHQELFLKHYPNRRDRLSLIWGGGQTTPTDTPRPVLSIVPRRGLRHAS